MTAPPAVRGARAAFSFLTRVPVGGYPYSDADWRWAAAWFPFVGLCVGLVMAAVWREVHPAGPWVAAAVSLTCGLLLTGAFHEDGLADTADALGGAYTREKLFEILKDSRIGTFGAAALILSFLLRASLWAALAERAEWGLVLTQCLSRVPPVWLMVALPYVSGPDSKSRSVVKSAPAQALWATLWPVLLLTASSVWGLITRTQLAGVVVSSIAVTVLCGWRFWKRAGGITGDFLGATQQVVECVALLALVLT